MKAQLLFSLILCSVMIIIVNYAQRNLLVLVLQHAYGKIPSLNMFCSKLLFLQKV